MAQMSPEERKAAIVGVFDRASPSYDQVGLDFFGPIGARLVSLAAPRPGERVLDLGCGRGATALPAAAAVGPTGRVLAIDLAPGMVEAVRRAADDLPWLTAEVGDAEEPAPGPWDVVLASLSLFFLPDPGTAVARIRDGLTVDGRLAFTWFGGADPRWDRVHDALVAPIPEHGRPPVRSLPREGPFSSEGAMADFLRDRGFREVATESHRTTIRFRDVAQWWEWTWSQGARVLLEQLEAHGALEQVRPGVDRLIADLADDGDLSWWTDVRYTVARA